MIINVLAELGEEASEFYNAKNMWLKIVHFSPLGWIVCKNGHCGGIVESCTGTHRKFGGKTFNFLGFIGYLVKLVSIKWYYS